MVVMSATLDAGKFQKYFDDAPLLVRRFGLFPLTCHYSHVILCRLFLVERSLSKFIIHLNQSETIWRQQLEP